MIKVTNYACAKMIATIALIGVSALTITACNSPHDAVLVAAGDIAKLVKASPTACADLALLGSDANTVAAQVAAANPNSTAIQKAAADVQAGGAESNSECQTLAASFKAEAPKSQLTRLIPINKSVWAKLAK